MQSDRGVFDLEASTVCAHERKNAGTFEIKIELGVNFSILSLLSRPG